jgi:hypothetical protein
MSLLPDRSTDCSQSSWRVRALLLVTIWLCLLACLQAAACPCACSASSALLGSTARAPGQQAAGQPGTDSPGAQTASSTYSRYAGVDTAQQLWVVGAAACSVWPFYALVVHTRLFGCMTTH